jgi:hypothetical protein
MPIEETLKKVESDIAAGDYGRARDRLHGLLATYPDDLALRRRLGDIYWKLQYPAMAGRYWYLEKDKTPAMAAACEQFERACQHDPLQTLLALKFKGDVDAIAATYAGRTLLALHEQARARHSHYVDFREQGAARWRQPAGIDERWNNVLAVGCVAAFLIALGLMIVGCVTVAVWIF